MMRMPAMNGGRGGSNGRNGSSQNESPSSAFSNWRKQNTGNNVAPGFKRPCSSSANGCCSA